MVKLVQWIFKILIVKKKSSIFNIIVILDMKKIPSRYLQAFKFWQFSIKKKYILTFPFLIFLETNL